MQRPVRGKGKSGRSRLLLGHVPAAEQETPECDLAAPLEMMESGGLMARCSAGKQPPRTQR
jgi:hypothetical protein